tara:strand:- start:678 stop:866 length:189 start_codon:yes stop_codon:yes gene_type:complete
MFVAILVLCVGAPIGSTIAIWCVRRCYKMNRLKSKKAQEEANVAWFKQYSEKHEMANLVALK